MTTFNSLAELEVLLEKEPEIIQNVPLKIIASYLNITDSSLSRIRREIHQKRSA